MKKAMSIFLNDLKIAIKDPISLWIALAPLLIAALIVWFTPGVSDTSLYISTVKSEPQMVEYFEKIAKVEVFDTREEVEARVLKTDSSIGILGKEDEYEIIAQGNENGKVDEVAKILLTLYLRGSDINETKSEIYTFGEKMAPIKRSFASSLLLMITMLTGMIISSGIIDDKTDNTINSVNVTPTKRMEYVIGKSVIGVVLLIFSSVASLLILGITDVNWLQLFVVLMTTSLISMIIGFLMGLTSSDIIEAAASIKILMVPMMASILVEELTSPKWHFTVYWSPFYWAYKSLKEIIVMNTASWDIIIITIVVVILVTVLTYFGTKKKMREGLS